MSFNVVSEIAIVPDNECNIPTLISLLAKALMLIKLTKANTVILFSNFKNIIIPFNNFKNMNFVFNNVF